MKEKYVAAFLAFAFGIFGVHRFYLGNRGLGIAHLLLFFITVGISAAAEAPIVLIPALLGFIDFVLLAAMPREEFDRKYNAAYLHSENIPVRFSRAPERSDRQTLRSLKAEGIQLFREYRYAEAIDAFEEALELAPRDPSLHFNLACCFAELENSAAAFGHLEDAFANGFDQPHKLREHRALAWLRKQPLFEVFIANGYRMKPAALPSPKPADLLDAKPASAAAPESPKSLDLLEQIAQLGELREKGILDEMEFAEQKKRILGQL